MSAPNNPVIVGGGGNGITNLESSIQPEIREANGDRAVRPAYVETLRTTVENDNRTHTTLCGDTKVEPVGEREERVTVEGLLLLEQLNELKALRPAATSVDVICDEGVKRDINFDRFTYNQTDETNVGTFNINGEEVTQPLYEFQLQMTAEDT